MKFEIINNQGPEANEVSPTVIKIVGCGGGGSSAVGRMIEADVSGVQFIVLNTDLQALNKSPAKTKLAIGQKLTGGLGAGGNPTVGENAAKEDTEMITNILKGADMVVITAGMGGGTGTGSAPIVAEIARKQGTLTIAVVTTPFNFEGTVRMRYALEGLQKLKDQVDALIVIPNEQVMKNIDRQVSFLQAFRMADTVLCEGVQGLSDIITKTGVVNIDFADVQSVMRGQGDAILGVGTGSGENRAIDAATAAISNPLLVNRQIDGATKILVNITSSAELPMMEVNDIVNTVRASAAKDNQMFWGEVLEPEMGDTISVTVVATGFNDAAAEEPAEEAAPVRQSVQEEKNIYSYEEFEDILAGKPTAPSVDTRPMFNTDTALARQDGADGKNTQPDASVKPEDYGVMKPTSYDSADLSIPTVLRQRDGLSRTINLSRK